MQIPQSPTLATLRCRKSGTRSLFPVFPAVNAHLGAGGTASPVSLQINQVNVGQSMTKLYYQCRTERESTFKNNATELGGCASFGFEAGGKKSGLALSSSAG